MVQHLRVPAHLRQPAGHHGGPHAVVIEDHDARATRADVDFTLLELTGQPDDDWSLYYAGWDAGQLEEELAQNSWLTVPAKSSILFDMPPEERLAAAMQKLGISFTQLSDVAGHA